MIVMRKSFSAKLSFIAPAVRRQMASGPTPEPRVDDTAPPQSRSDKMGIDRKHCGSMLPSAGVASGSKAEAKVFPMWLGEDASNERITRRSIAR